MYPLGPVIVSQTWQTRLEKKIGCIIVPKFHLRYSFIRSFFCVKLLLTFLCIHSYLLSWECIYFYIQCLLNEIYCVYYQILGNSIKKGVILQYEMYNCASVTSEENLGEYVENFPAPSYVSVKIIKVKKLVSAFISTLSDMFVMSSSPITYLFVVAHVL